MLVKTPSLRHFGSELNMSHCSIRLTKIQDIGSGEHNIRTFIEGFDLSSKFLNS